MTSPKTLARVAGALYVLASVAFVFAGSVRARILIPDNPALTAENIRASVALFRLGLAIDLLSGVLFLFMVMAFYLLFRRVDMRLAGAMVVFVIIGVAVGWFTVLPEYAALIVATRPEYASALGPTGSDALVLLFAEIQRGGLVMNQMFSGLWLFPLGALVSRSGYFPRLLGQLLIIGGFTWVALFFLGTLAPDLARAASILVIGAVGELIFMAWLLVRGANVPQESSTAVLQQ